MTKFLRKTWGYYNYNLKSGNKETLNVFKLFIVVKYRASLNKSAL